MRLVIFGPDGKVMAELLGVTQPPSITRSGALVCHLGPGPLRRWVGAPGAWQHVEEWADELPALQLPVIPGLPDPFLTAPNALAGSMTEQMAVHCMCAELRCPETVGPPTSGERAWWRLRLSRPQGVAPGMSPFRQCATETGHAGEHVWPGETGWPYGIHNHHPDCPRNPDRYNRPVEEGHPGTPPVGLTSTDEPEQAWCFPAHEPEISGMVQLAHELPGTADLVGIGVAESTQRILVRPLPTQGWNQTAREVWGSCSAYGPQQADGGTIVCCLEPQHPGTHEAKQQGGERVYW